MPSLSCAALASPPTLRSSRAARLPVALVATFLPPSGRTPPTAPAVLRTAAVFCMAVGCILSVGAFTDIISTQQSEASFKNVNQVPGVHSENSSSLDSWVLRATILHICKSQGFQLTGCVDQTLFICL
ncbi:uncharacterized protein PS065_004546 isoform 1-T2 [Dugong dugon]